MAGMDRLKSLRGTEAEPVEEQRLDLASPALLASRLSFDRWSPEVGPEDSSHAPREKTADWVNDYNNPQSTISFYVGFFVQYWARFLSPGRTGELFPQGSLPLRGTASGERAVEDELTRMAVDWWVRTSIPICLDAAQLVAAADMLRSLPAVTPQTAAATLDVLKQVTELEHVKIKVNGPGRSFGYSDVIAGQAISLMGQHSAMLREFSWDSLTDVCYQAQRMAIQLWPWDAPSRESVIQKIQRTGVVLVQDMCAVSKRGVAGLVDHTPETSDDHRMPDSIYARTSQALAAWIQADRDMILKAENERAAFVVGSVPKSFR